MADILIGLAAGLALAVAVWVGYRQGLKDGGGQRRTRRTGNGETEQEQDALMKKYEAILDYDPYGEHV